ncbi:MAG: ATP synthase F0 subunit C [Candidatus Melainabacteria bacterium]|jgi:F-type H+-transporting ATPase subunit c|nr:ATP synthase F0 subunit C [Candidatus Melainabacteria bacterium]
MEAVVALSYGAPLAVGLAAVGPGIGLGLMTAAFFNSSARQPEIQGKLFIPYIITLGAVELLGLFGFVSFFLIFSKATA